MTDRAVVDVVGVRVEVEAPDHQAGALGDGLRDVVVDALADCSILVEGPEIEAVVAAAVREAIKHAPGLLLHAGAVARDGQAVIFPGESGTGKSTLTAACVRRGFGYLTDEVVAIDLCSSTMTGFARPLMLTRWAAAELGLDVMPGKPKVPVTAERLGGTTVGGSLYPAHIVELRHGAVETALEPMTAGETLTSILRASFNHHRHGERAWRAAGDLAGRARGWRLDVTDLDSAVDAIESLTSVVGAS